MPRYELKCFAVLRAASSVEAEQKLTAALDTLREGESIEFVGIDDSSSTVRLEDDE